MPHEIRHPSSWQTRYGSVKGASLRLQLRAGRGLRSPGHWMAPNAVVIATSRWAQKSADVSGGTSLRMCPSMLTPHTCKSLSDAKGSSSEMSVMSSRRLLCRMVTGSNAFGMKLPSLVGWRGMPRHALNPCKTSRRRCPAKSRGRGRPSGLQFGGRTNYGFFGPHPDWRPTIA